MPARRKAQRVDADLEPLRMLYRTALARKPALAHDGDYRPRGLLSRIPTLFWSMLLLLCGVSVAYHAAVLEYRAEDERQREMVRAALEPIRAALSRELFSALQLTEGVAGLIAIEGHIADDKLRAFVAELLGRNVLIRNVAMAPDNVVRFVFPQQGNEQAIGLDYTRSTAQWPSVARMIREHRLIVAGPVELVQGGVGIIGRKPIYLSGPQHGAQEGQYWGLISTVVSFDELLTRAALDKIDDRLDVALRGTDGRGAEGPAFWGNPAVFAASPATVDVPLPAGFWQLAATPRGGWPPLRVQTSPYFLGGSLLAAVLAAFLHGLLRTSSARQRVAVALTERDRQLKAAMRAGRVGFWRWERDTDSISLSDEIHELYGRRGKRPLTLHELITELVPSDEANAVKDALAQARRGRRVSIDHRVRRSDGKLAWFSTQAEATYDSHGEVQALLGTFIDITERKRAEETLRTREQHLSRVYDAVDDVVFLLSVDAGEQYRFVSINAAFARVTGFTAESVLGQAVSSVVPAAALPQLLEKCREAIEHRRLVRWEEIVDYPAGRLFGEIAVAPVFDRAGRCIQLVGSIHDVTERNRAWDEINSLNAHLQRHAEELEQRVSERTSELARAKERAESADRLKSAFLATMSHELRTPLNSIIGFTGIVMQEMAGPLNEEQKKQLGMVYGSAQHLLALINDVLDISKIEAGELVVSAAPFDLRASIGKVIGLIQPLADKKGLELDVHVAEGVGDMVGDARRVEQILLNLLSNAVKFTERGAVSLTAELVHDHGAPDASSDPAVQLRVKDTGIGIRPENMVLLFAPFRQIDSTLTRAYEGTGLGLAISQRLAALMGGRIEATSRWQQGSEFIVSLPLREPLQGRA